MSLNYLRNRKEYIHCAAYRPPEVVSWQFVPNTRKIPIADAVPADQRDKIDRWNLIDGWMYPIHG